MSFQVLIGIYRLWSKSLGSQYVFNHRSSSTRHLSFLEPKGFEADFKVMDQAWTQSRLNFRRGTEMACANLPYFEIKPNARNVVMKHIQINDGQLGMKTVYEEIETLKMLYPENFKYALGLTGSGLTVYLALAMDVRLKQFVKFGTSRTR